MPQAGLFGRSLLSFAAATLVVAAAPALADEGVEDGGNAGEVSRTLPEQFQGFWTLSRAQCDPLTGRPIEGTFFGMVTFQAYHQGEPVGGEGLLETATYLDDAAVSVKFFGKDEPQVMRMRPDGAMDIEWQGRRFELVRCPA